MYSCATQAHSGACVIAYAITLTAAQLCRDRKELDRKSNFTVNLKIPSRPHQQIPEQHAGN